MVVLGIDPGYAIVGWGVVYFSGNMYKPLGFGAVTTEPEMKFTKRLEYIHSGMSRLMLKCKPDAVAIEKLYFQNNQKTAIDVAQARGVILLAAEQRGIPVFEYTPLQIKQALVGYGRAEKKQVQQMVKAILNLEEVPKPDDTADAVAAAICHGHASGNRVRQYLNRSIR